MHRSRWLALAPLGLFLACDSLLRISIPFESTTVVEEGTVLEEFISDIGFGDFIEMDVTSSAELENQGVAPGDIVDTYLTLFELEVSDPAEADLTFLDSMELYVESPGLPRVLVAWQDTFPAGEGRVEFEIEDVDLSAYVVSQSLTIDTEVTGRRPDTDTEIIARTELSVGVTSQGACAFISGS